MKTLLFGIFAVFFIFTGSVLAEVNINTATQAELEALQGIGPAKAKAIVEYREANGPFTSTESLVNVDGIGQGTMKQLGDSVTIGKMPDPETKSVMAHQE